MSFLGPAAYFDMICIYFLCIGHHFKRWQKAGDYLTRVTFSPLCSKCSASPMVKKRLGGGVNKCGCPLPSAACSSVKFMLPLQSFSCQVSSTADPFLQTPATHFHDVFHLWEVFLWMWDSETVFLSPLKRLGRFGRHAYFPNVLWGLSQAQKYW